MDKRDRLRCSALLCCHCVRNIAYYRAGWRDGVLLQDTDFWRNVTGNFLDIAVLEWCKLFADQKAKHHWKRVVPEPDSFLASLLSHVGETEDSFDAYCTEMRTYRDKFLAHLDAERTIQIPRLNTALDTSVFLFGTVRSGYSEMLSDAPENLESFYDNRLQYAESEYPAT